MQRRRSWIKNAGVGLAALLFTRNLNAQEGNGFNAAELLSNQSIPSLENQLLRGLRVINDDQRKFVTRVVNAVRQGRMPRAMVNVVYKWALERNAKFPFPYFQYALNILARRRGISL